MGKLNNWSKKGIGELEIKEIIYKIFAIILVDLTIISIVSPNDHLFQKTDADSARYLLSSLVQSEAAIIAIVLTLSLIAVQLTAASYSARVIDIFQRSAFWMLLSHYILSMSYSLWVLMNLLPTNINENANKNLYADLYLSYWFGILAIFALVPYTWNTLQLLKPNMIIKKLSDKVNVKYLTASLGGGDDPPPTTYGYHYNIY